MDLLGPEGAAYTARNRSLYIRLPPQLAQTRSRRSSIHYIGWMGYIVSLTTTARTDSVPKSMPTVAVVVVSDAALAATERARAPSGLNPPPTRISNPSNIMEILNLFPLLLRRSNVGNKEEDAQDCGKVSTALVAALLHVDLVLRMPQTWLKRADLLLIPHSLLRILPVIAVVGFTRHATRCCPPRRRATCCERWGTTRRCTRLTG